MIPIQFYLRSSSAEMHRRQQQLLQQQQAQRQMSSMMHQRPAHSQPHQSSASTYDSSSRYKVIDNVQSMSHSLSPPFKKSHCAIQNINVPCVNMNPYSDSESLISVFHFNEKLFPNSSFDNCVERLSVLKIQQYLGNR